MLLPDAEWADLARAARRSLVHMGFYCESGCLPDEPSPCGGTFAQHAAVNLARLRAVTDHHLAHLAAPSAVIEDEYKRVLLHLNLPPCQGTQTRHDPLQLLPPEGRSLITPYACGR
jgi:hypothetical protein